MANIPEERRILLERLNLKTSTSDIERFFTKWGPLSECVVMFDKVYHLCIHFSCQIKVSQAVSLFASTQDNSAIQ